MLEQPTRDRRTERHEATRTEILEAAWAQVRARLERAHEDFAAALAGLSAGQLLEPLDKSWLSPELVTRRIDYAIDIATHDIYHAGQIFVLKRLFGRGQPGSHSGA